MINNPIKIIKRKEAEAIAEAKIETKAAARHTVLDELNASLGQVALEPVQVSATSQTPAVARQVTLDAARVSLGQATLEPSQFSATSQAPAVARHS